jgi:hypothetical protein
MKTLPIYRLGIPQQPGLNRMHEVSRGLFGVEDFSVHETDGGRLLRATTRLTDIEARAGAIWAADRAELWNPDTRPRLPNK